MEENPSNKKILLKLTIILVQYFFCIQFTRKELFLSLALGSSQYQHQIFLAVRQEDLSTRKILSPCKLPSLGRSQYQVQTRQRWWRVVKWVIMAMNVDDFIWRCIPRADNCDNFVKRQLVKRTEGSKLHFCCRVGHFLVIPLFLGNHRDRNLCM